MTPEGKVKQKIKQVLLKYDRMYRFMPVPFGWGASSLDFILCFRGHFIAIEAKRPGKEPTGRQSAHIDQIRRAGGKVFVIDGTDKTDSLEALDKYLNVIAQAPAPDTIGLFARYP